MSLSNNSNSTMEPILVKSDHENLVEEITLFLKEHSGYDMMPVSCSTTVLDAKLLLTKAVTALIQNNIENAPIYDSKAQQYSGLLTTFDLNNIIHFYYTEFSYQDALEDTANLKLDRYLEISRLYQQNSPTELKNYPLDSLFSMAERLLSSNSSAITLVDSEPGTKKDVIVTTISKYQILQFIATNLKGKELMKQNTITDLGIGSFGKLYTATMDTPIIDIIKILVADSVSSVLILDDQGTLLNAFTRSDVIFLVKEQLLTELTLPVSRAFDLRPEDYVGIHTCGVGESLWSIMNFLRKKRIHQIIVVDKDTKPLGVISLSDILKALLYVN